MSSILPGYEYDIFISYRQKDNKGDRWVSEFVEALKTELESTFKEEISVYFDINPHDGLLETHDVDASLKDKLKCLVFIPIISRTYCDPKSFAWEHEFKTFVEQAAQDQFGLKVKLPNGNVVNRVLPVRIHDLDNDDIKLCESVLKGVLRGVEFIYKSPGVNRSLRSIEDRPNDNLNKTLYRDQINKVALAIRDILIAIKHPGQKTEEIIKEVVNVKPEKPKKLIPKAIVASVILFALIVLGYFLIPTLSKSKGQLDKSIAVLPFVNNSPYDSNQHFIDGTMDAILDNLCKIADFKVVSRTSVEPFRKPSKSVSEIAKKLGVRYILEGSGQKYENNIRLTVQLIDAKKDNHLWSHSYDRDWKDIFKMQSEIAHSIASELKTIISPEEKRRIEKTPTKNLEAYDLYLKGKSYYDQHTRESVQEGIKYFNNAIQLDSTYALAYVSLAQSYQFMVRYSWMPRDEGNREAKDEILKALELDESLGEAHAALALLMIVLDLNIYGPEKEFQKAIQLSPNSSEVYSSYAQYLRWIGNYDLGITIAKRAAELDPLTPLTCIWVGALYFYAGKYDLSIENLEKTLTLDSSFVYTYTHLASDYSLKGSYAKANFYADKAISIRDTRNDPLSIGFLGWVYAKSGEKSKAKNILAHLVELSNNQNVDPVLFAIINEGLGEKEMAFNWLSKAYESRSGALIYLNCYANSFLKDISSDPRYKDLLKKIGFRIN